MYKKIISAVMSSCLLFGSVAYAGAAQTDYTVDEKIEALKQLEIVNCYEDGSFQPDNNITRAEFCKMMSKILGIKEGEIRIDCEVFADVPLNHWANEYVTFCYIKALVIGTEKGNKIFSVTTENGEETEIENLEIKEELARIYDVAEMTAGTFNPDGYISCQDAVKMVVKALGYEPVAERYGNYPDGYMTTARKYDLIGNRINGTDLLTRSDAAELIYNALYTPLMLSEEEENQVSYHIADGENGSEYETLYTRLGKVIKYELPQETGIFNYSLKAASQQISDFVIVTTTPVIGMKMTCEATSATHKITLNVVDKESGNSVCSRTVSVIEGFEEEFWIDFTELDVGREYYLMLTNLTNEPVSGIFTITG